LDTSVGADAQALALGDLDSDGKVDIAIGRTIPKTIQTFIGNGDGTLKAPVTYTSNGPTALFIAELNGDGKTDLLSVEGGLKFYPGSSKVATISAGDQQSTAVLTAFQ